MQMTAATDMPLMQADGRNHDCEPINDYKATIRQGGAAKGDLAIGEIFDWKTMQYIGIAVTGEG